MIKDKVIAIGKNFFISGKISLSTKLVEDLGMDEVDKIDVVFCS